MKTKTKKTRSSKSKKLTKNTHIALALDKSGSMLRHWKEAMDGFNAQLDVIAENSELGGNTTVSLIVFDSTVDVRQTAVKPADIEKLSKANYRPEGGTAMYDAVWKSIEVLEKLDDGGNDTAFLVITVSDGEELSSKRVIAQKLADRISELNLSERWTFAYVGANQDLSEVNKNLNICRGNSLSYTDSATGYVVMNNAVSTGVSNYMTSRSIGTCNTSNLFDTTTFVGEK